MRIHIFYRVSQISNLGRFVFLTSGVALTEWLPSFDKEALAFKILLTQRAVEALRMIVVVESLHPAVTGFYWEPAGYAFGGEELIPIFFTVRKPIFQIEW